MNLIIVVVLIGLIIAIMIKVAKPKEYSNQQIESKLNPQKIEAEIELENDDEIGEPQIHRIIIDDFKKDDNDWWYIVGKDIETGKNISTEGERCDWIKVGEKEFNNIPHLMKTLYLNEEILFLGKPNSIIQLSFDYVNNNGEQSSRSVSVRKIFRKAYELYLTGLDSKSQEERTFKLLKMKNLINLSNSKPISDAESLLSWFEINEK